MARSRVSGSARVRRLLRRLPDTVQAGVRTEIAAAAQRIHDDAAPAIPAPGSHPYATGFMRTSFKVSLSKDGLQARIGWFGRVYQRAAHAHLVEFGTAAGSRPAKDGTMYHHPGVPPHPILVPAYRKNRGENFRRIRAAIRRAMDHASRHGGAE